MSPPQRTHALYLRDAFALELELCAAQRVPCAALDRGDPSLGELDPNVDDSDGVGGPTIADAIAGRGFGAGGGAAGIGGGDDGGSGGGTPVPAWASNAGVLALLDGGATGALCVIDEQSNYHNTTDATLLKKLLSTHAKSPLLKAHKGSSGMSRSRGESGGARGRGGDDGAGAPGGGAGEGFIVRHAACDLVLSYEVDGFLERNRDRLDPAHTALLRTSKLPLVHELFAAEVEDLVMAYCVRIFFYQ